MYKITVLKIISLFVLLVIICISVAYGVRWNNKATSANTVAQKTPTGLFMTGTYIKNPLPVQKVLVLENMILFAAEDTQDGVKFVKMTSGKPTSTRFKTGISIDNFDENTWKNGTDVKENGAYKLSSELLATPATPTGLFMVGSYIKTFLPVQKVLILPETPQILVYAAEDTDGDVVYLKMVSVLVSSVAIYNTGVSIENLDVTTWGNGKYLDKGVYALSL
jgi:hypothetical protein